MSGLLTNGFAQLGIITGSEQLALDTEIAAGSAPQSAMSNLQELALALSQLSVTVDKTTVSGTRYYRSIPVGYAQAITGVKVKVGSTGGTDKWIAELHSPTGALLATSDTSGTTAGTANTWQELAFTGVYDVTVPGTYYIAIQSNGTTAKLATLDAPASPVLTGSAAGTFGTGAAITPPTSYTANLGPAAVLY